MVVVVVCTYFDGSVADLASKKASLATRPASVDDWTPTDVSSWVAGIVDSTAFTEKLVENAVDGKLLLHLELSDLSSDIGMSALQAKKVMIAIEELTASISANPSSLWEYRAANRKYVDNMFAWMMGSPRGPLLYVHAFDYETVWRPAFREVGGVEEGSSSGGGSIGFWIGWLLAPDLVVIFCATNFLGIHPWLASWVIFAFVMRQLGMIVVAFLNVAKVASQTGQDVGVGQIVFSYFVIGFTLEAIVGGTILFNSCVLWHITPWFLSDFFFYSMIIGAPFAVLTQGGNMVQSIVKRD